MNAAVMAECPSPAPPASADVRSRRARTIQGALPIVARGIGRRMNVEVRIGGSEAKTNGRVITLPTLPFDDPEVETLAFGFLEHEAAHVRYTQPVETESALHHRLCNSIEDIRIERELGREFPGFAANLGRLVHKLVKTGVLQRPSAEESPGVKLRRYLSYRLRAEVLDQSGLRDYATQAETLFRQAFPQGACVRIGSVIGRVPALRSTQDAADLAREILDILKEEAQEPPPPTDGDGGKCGATAAPGEGMSSAGAQETQGQQAQGRTTVRELLQAPESELGGELSEVLGAALQEAADQAITRGGGQAGGFGRADEPLQPPPGDSQAILASVHDESLALRTRLRSSVEAVRHSRRSYVRRGTRIARQRLVGAMLGDARICAHKRLGRDANTAIEVLCDRSISMSGKRLAIASRCVLAAASGLSAIRHVALEAGVFPGCAGEVEVLTAFGQTLRRTATRYAAISASGGTPLYEALLWGFERLLLRKEPRKILVCATDGKPPESTRPACRQAIEAAMRGGIEVYGIGIDVPDIGTLFPISESIADVSQLAPALFGFLRQAMTGRTGP